MMKRMLSWLLAICLVLGMLPLFALAGEEGEKCLQVSANAPTSGTIAAGGIYEVALKDVFTHSQSHAVTYSFTANVESQHNKIKGETFYFSAPEGAYEVTLTAKCEGAEVEHKIAITVEKGNEGIAAQYSYNETHASSVTVYVTMSNDGYPILATDGTVMSHLEVTVPYFDLAEYGLESYYRYGTDGGQGTYANDTLIQRPTGLHLYLYLLERYYMGLPAKDCGKGMASGVLSYYADAEVYYMDNELAYESNGKSALTTTGGATSIYMVNFWGHDENLMYFRNHVYPYMSPGWGSTSDYILLSDGDTWDVAMFTNWDFYHVGYFACFDRDAYTAEAGSEMTVSTQAWGTSAEAVAFEAKTGLTVGLYNDKWELVQELRYAEGNKLTFTTPETAGTYYLLAMDPHAKDGEDACIAPATAVVTVEAKVVCETCTDENSDRICDACEKDLNNLPALAEGITDATATVQTGIPYQLDELVGGKTFQDADKDNLSYFYRKSSDNGQSWGEWAPIGVKLEHGGETKSLVNDTEGVYLYEFKANDGYGDSADRWFLTLNVLDVVPANIKFYVAKDQNFNEETHPEYPILELYRTAGLDENLFDYVGWFVNGEGKTEYVYNPQDYTIIDGKTDYVVVDGVQYELYGYEKIAFTNSAFDDTDASATPSGTLVDGYNMFYATITTGRYSTRGYGKNPETGAYDVYLGGQSMELPREKDIYGNGGDDIYLRVITVHTTSKKVDETYFTANDYYVEMIMPITGSMIHSGDPFVSGNYTKFPFLSWASGNGSLYNYYAYPYDTDNYIFAQAINNTTSAAKTVDTKTITIGTAIPLSVTVPESGVFGLYFQYNNFNTKEVEPAGEAVLNGDGTKTILYRVTKNNGNYTWRLTDPSGQYVTKSGWLKNVTVETEKVITFSAFTNKASHDFSNLGTTVDTRDEADIQVFLSGSGFKSVAEQTRIRAYRMWQLINTDSANIMIEPDFNIQVLQGNPNDITLVNGGNAVGNWIDVLPTTTDIVAVNYDALEVYSNNDNYGGLGGFFPATNPERTNVFIITNQPAGAAAAHVAFNGSKTTDRGTEWDYNYDTWFYLDSNTQPTLDFTVTGTGYVNVSYATVTTGDDLKSTLSPWTTVTADAEGNYTADLLSFRNAGTKGGTVIIRTIDSTGTSYLLVRVAEMKAIITNQTVPGETPMPGNTITVTFDNLYRSVNKISGVFNPTKYNLMYTLNGEEMAAGLGQYQQMDQVSYTIAIPMDLGFPEGADSIEYVLTNGYVDGTMYSAASPFNTMYYMTDTGMGTNFSAVGTVYVLSKMADIPITITKPVLYDLKLAAEAEGTVLEGATFTLTGPNGENFEADENGIYQDMPVGEYSYTFSKLGYISQVGTLRVTMTDTEFVVDGILTKTFAVDKAAEGAWDGITATEPKAENGVYQIGTGAELAWFAQTVNNGQKTISAVLTADIELAANNWTPIGNSTVKYSGTFDGKNHKIQNLAIINDAAATGVGYGLFGYVADATIQNLCVDGEIRLTNSGSVSNAYAGGIVGANTGVLTMTNVHSAVDINITRVKGNWNRVGGLVGSSNTAIITNCSNSGNITGYNYIGGIAGYNGKGTISNCYNTGNLSGYQYVGGIVATCPPGYVHNCYNTGDVTATNNYAAGIVANDTGVSEVTNCFNIGTVTFGGTSSYAGSVVGNSNNGTGINANLYYLEGTYSVGIGTNKNGVDATAISAQELTSAAFVAKMNAGLETAAYKMGVEHPILVWQPSEVEEVQKIYGDVNGDGDVTLSDCLAVLQYIRGEAETTEAQTELADVDGNGEIEMRDYLYILQYIRGEITKFPAES